MSEHGEYSKYTNEGCRCELCRRANADHQLSYLSRYPNQAQKHRDRERKRYHDKKKGGE